MKKLLLFIGLLLTFSSLNAQKKVVKTFKSSNLEDVFVHLKFANNIVVKNWDKNEVSIEAEVNINQNKGNDYYSLKGEDIGGTLTVKSDYESFFKEHQNNFRKNNNDCKSYKYCTCNNSIVINYVLNIPRNMKLKIKSISGDVKTTAYIGDLTLDLISGNIDVKKHSENMHLKTISGDIDVYVSDATFNAKTLTGGIYSDLDIDFGKGNKKSFGQRVSGTVKKGNAYLKLETISGDIFLRKI